VNVVQLSYPPAVPVLWDAWSLRKEQPGRTRVRAQLFVEALELARAKFGFIEVDVARADAAPVSLVA
jgi:hypothetical protein